MCVCRKRNAVAVHLKTHLAQARASGAHLMRAISTHVRCVCVSYTNSCGYLAVGAAVGLLIASGSLHSLSGRGVTSAHLAHTRCDYQFISRTRLNLNIMHTLAQRRTHTHTYGTYLAGTWHPETEWCFVKNGAHLNERQPNAIPDRPSSSDSRSRCSSGPANRPNEPYRPPAYAKPFYHHRFERHRSRRDRQRQHQPGRMHQFEWVALHRTAAIRTTQTDVDTATPMCASNHRRAAKI